jgi:hypothetical protein
VSLFSIRMFIVKSYIIVNCLIWIPLSSFALGFESGILHGSDSRFQAFHLLLRFFQFRPISLCRLYQGIEVSFGISFRHSENQVIPSSLLQRRIASTDLRCPKRFASSKQTRASSTRLSSRSSRPLSNQFFELANLCGPLSYVNMVNAAAR